MMEIQEAFTIFQITCIFSPTMYMFWFEDKEIRKQKWKKKKQIKIKFKDPRAEWLPLSLMRLDIGTGKHMLWSPVAWSKADKETQDRHMTWLQETLSICNWYSETT